MTNKPYFKCPLELKHRPDGTLEFHVTRRDGVVEIISGPPGVKQINSHIEALQRADSDEIDLLFASGRPPL